MDQVAGTETEQGPGPIVVDREGRRPAGRPPTISSMGGDRLHDAGIAPYLAAATWSRERAAKERT